MKNRLKIISDILNTKNCLIKECFNTKVSGNGQKDGLKNQVEFLRQFANVRVIMVDEVIEDIGSGLNYNRKK